MTFLRVPAQIILCLIVSAVARATDLPRVAVVPDSPEPFIAAFADFLSASLAKNSGQYALVERAEISRLASEAEVQKLAADQRPAALAKLAKADGLVIVGADKGDPKLPKLTLRLTSTNNGLVLRSLVLGGKEAEFAQAAELAAGVLRFPCERLAHGDAKPPIIISLLGIRPAFEADRALETTLNLAVAQQLSAQSGMAVSERWRMNDLVFERSLTDENFHDFATGTILLDGSYTRKGDELEVSLRLRKAEAEEGKKLQLKGTPTQPAELAGAIAKLIATESGQSGEAVVWNALEESKQYADLGWWLLKRKLSQDSAQAYEVAKALGQMDGPVLRGSVFAYQQIVDINGDVKWPRTDIGDWDSLPKEEFKFKVLMAIRMSQLAIEAMEAKWGGANFEDFTLNNRRLTLLRSLDSNMKVLQALCLRKEQLELAQEARSLRALSRELVAHGEADVNQRFSFREPQLFYMFDTPEEAAADLRSRLLPEFIDSCYLLGYYQVCDGTFLREQLWETFHDPDLWRFVDWTSVDNKAGVDAWKDFIKELQGSNHLLKRTDGLALAFQSTRDSRQQQDILAAYCKLLEENFNELLTPQGQLTFRCFAHFYRRSDRTEYPEFNFRMQKLLTRILESGVWLEPATFNMLNKLVRHLNITKNAIIPEGDIFRMLGLLEQYLARAKSDPRWKSGFRGDDRGVFMDLPANIILAYPNISARRIEARAGVEGAVPILAWKPDFSNSTSRRNWMNGEYMVSSGDSLMIPTEENGLIDLDVRAMSVSRIIRMPLTGKHFMGDFAATGKLLMMNVDNRLFTAPLTSDGKSWTEIHPSGVTQEDRLRWLIEPTGDDFFVGSYMVSGKSATRMLAGIVRDGKLNWVVSSSRRPAANRIDEMDPRNTRFAYRNAQGKTMVLLGNLYDRTPLLELETGREVSSTGSMGEPQRRGEMKLYWRFTGQKIDSLMAFDPAEEKPSLMIHDSGYKLPEIWNGMKAIYDGGKPEFRGECIAAIVHGGKLWILKREPVPGGKVAPDDPQSYRLVCAGLKGGEVSEIPLNYDVSKATQQLDESDKKGFLRPIINKRSLTATPKGLFFVCAGFNNGPGTSSFNGFGFQCGGDLVPALLYITWNDINAWLAKNSPESAKPSP